MAIARVTIPDVQPITVVSVYNVIDDVYAQTTLLRIIADLIPLFDSADGARVILGGDLNMSTAQKAGPDLERASGILEALKGLGLRDLAEQPLTERPERWPSARVRSTTVGTFGRGARGTLITCSCRPSSSGRSELAAGLTATVEDRQLSDHCGRRRDARP